MQKLFRAILIILFSICGLLLSQENNVVDNQLIVYGNGTIEVPANRAQISFTVIGFGPTLQSAIQSTREKVGNISSKLFATGLSKANLTTSSFNSGDNYDGKAFWSSGKDYRTQIDVYINIDSLELIEAVVSTLAAGEISRLSNLSFVLKSDTAYKLEARRLATYNAQQKAQVIANQLGVTIGKVQYVEELLSYSDGDFYIPQRQDLTRSLSYSISGASVGVGGTSSIYYGGQRFSIKSGVKIVYEIKNK